MIGMMNSGAESSVEFYASARQSSLYNNRKRSSQSRTYTPEGRVMINGEPASPHCADDMWKNVIIKAAAKKLIKDCEKPKQGALETIRRFSEKLKLRKTKSTSENPKKQPDEVHEEDDEEEDICKMNYGVESSSKLSQPSQKVDTNFVTMIRIDTVNQSINSNDADTTQIMRPDRLIENDSVLARLLEESSRIDRRATNIDEDSGKGSIDEDILKRTNHNDDVTVVEKM